MKDTTKAEIYSKIITWLYQNHEAYDSARAWRQALVDMLEETLLGTTPEVEFGEMAWTTAKKTKPKKS